MLAVGDDELSMWMAMSAVGDDELSVWMAMRTRGRVVRGCRGRGSTWCSVVVPTRHG